MEKQITYFKDEFIAMRTVSWQRKVNLFDLLVDILNIVFLPNRRSFYKVQFVDDLAKIRKGEKIICSKSKFLKNFDMDYGLYNLQNGKLVKVDA